MKEFFFNAFILGSAFALLSCSYQSTPEKSESQTTTITEPQKLKTEAQKSAPAVQPKPDPRKSDPDYVKTKEILTQSIIDFCGNGTFFSHKDGIGVLHNYFDTDISPLPHMDYTYGEEMLFCACGTLTKTNCLDDRVYFNEGLRHLEPGTKACVYGVIADRSSKMYLYPSHIQTDKLNKVKVYNLDEMIGRDFTRYIIPVSINRNEGGYSKSQVFFKDWIDKEQK